MKYFDGIKNPISILQLQKANDNSDNFSLYYLIE